jgi:N,N'-diacetyllegionaminate synthase
MKIAGHDLDEKVLIIAEIGNNHEGNVEVAKTLIRKAAACGVDAVKFQTFQTRYFVSSRDQARYERLLQFEIPYAQWEELHRLTKELGLLFFSTPLDLESAKFLKDLVDCYKIASGDNNFFPLIEQVCLTGKPIILSSGLSDLNQVQKAKEFIEAQWSRHGFQPGLAILHCVCSYPVPAEQANLAAVPYLKGTLGCAVGYSDHTLGLEACGIALALGAQIIEKHFTLDKNYSDFRDHQLSADPVEMQELVAQATRIPLMVGKPAKTIQPCEMELMQAVRRSIVAGADLTRGHRLNREDLLWLRPGTGLPPGEEKLLLGRTLKRDMALGEPFSLDDLE